MCQCLFDHIGLVPLFDEGEFWWSAKANALQSGLLASEMTANTEEGALCEVDMFDHQGGNLRRPRGPQSAAIHGSGPRAVPGTGSRSDPSDYARRKKTP